MFDLDLPTARLPAMSDEALERVRAAEAEMREMPQVEIHTSHLIHGGLYARTILIPKGVSLVGVLIKRATTLVLLGDALVYTGEGVMHLQGQHVIPASAGRKQAFMANDDTWLTMIFPTSATTVEQAEAEFTDEGDLLMSRTRPDLNHIHITGE